MNNDRKQVRYMIVCLDSVRVRKSVAQT